VQDIIPPLYLEKVTKALLRILTGKAPYKANSLPLKNGGKWAGLGLFSRVSCWFKGEYSRQIETDLFPKWFHADS